MPDLRSLSLEGIRMQWAEGQYINLTDLRISLTDNVDDDHPADEYILHIFRDSPCLRNIYISIPFPIMPLELWVQEHEAGGRPLGFIHLSSLTHLHLELDLRDLMYVVLNVSAPGGMQQVFIAARISDQGFSSALEQLPTGSA